LAWAVPIFGYPALAALSAAARLHDSRVAASPHAVIIPGGHGEYFVQEFASDGAATSPAQSQTPTHAAARLRQPWLIGAAAADFVALRGYGTAFAIEADARHALALDAQFFTTVLQADYARGADAKPQLV
jgi:hypothetical protein